MSTPNLFFEAPDPDRWVVFDRYPRRVYRRLFRRSRPVAGGYPRSFRNLRISLDRLGVPYRVNDFGHIRRRHGELACVYGYPHVLETFGRETPILFGAGGYSHPIDDPTLLERHTIKRILVKGAWMVEMCRPYWGDLVQEWAAPIDSDVWAPDPRIAKDIDVLVYDKIRWDRDRLVPDLVNPLLDALRRRGLAVATLRYGAYLEPDLQRLARRSAAMIFLCEHETQGLAYQRVLSTGVPVFAWDRGGYWQDPAYYPDRVRFQPVTSVPYWDERCGMTFRDLVEFAGRFDEFWGGVRGGRFAPRQFVLDTLSFDRWGQAYLAHVRACGG